MSNKDMKIISKFGKANGLNPYQIKYMKRMFKKMTREEQEKDIEIIKRELAQYGK